MLLLYRGTLVLSDSDSKRCRSRFAGTRMSQPQRAGDARRAIRQYGAFWGEDFRNGLVRTRHCVPGAERGWAPRIDATFAAFARSHVPGACNAGDRDAHIHARDTVMNATRAHAQRNESAVLTFVYLVFSSPSRLSASRPRPRCNPKAVMRQEKGSKVPRSNLPSIAAPLCLPSLAQPLDERCRRLLHLLELGRMPFDERGLLDQVDAVPIQGRAWQG